tara:strand:+ start:224 stop:529 length:306 start_codon:yes stop_codon:yes gene_type:complete
MRILDYNHSIETFEALKTSDDGGAMCFSSGKTSIPKSNLPSKAYIDGEETVLSAGFNQHSVVLPNGVKVRLSEDGAISVEEKGAAPKKLRHKDKVQQHLIS